MSPADFLPILGVLCVIYTTVEVVRLGARPRSPRTGTTSFGAVDVKTGEAVDVTIDRRVRHSHRGAAPERRSDPAQASDLPSPVVDLDR